MESEYLEEENGQPATTKPSNKAAATIAEREKKGAIETASNKRMRSANINTWTLRYNDESLESKVTLIPLMPLSYLKFEERYPVY